MVNGAPGWGGYYLSAYGIAVKHGFTGTEEEWLDFLKGADIEMKYENGALQWKNDEEEAWHTLYDFEALLSELLEKRDAATAAALSANTAAGHAEEATAAMESRSQLAEQALTNAVQQAIKDADAAVQRADTAVNVANEKAQAADAAAAKANEGADEASAAAGKAKETAAAANAAKENADAAALAVRAIGESAEQSALKADQAAGDLAKMQAEADQWFNDHKALFMEQIGRKIVLTKTDPGVGAAAEAGTIVFVYEEG